MTWDICASIQRIKRFWRFTSAKNHVFAPPIAQSNMVRLSWTAMVVVPLNVIHIGIFWGTRAIETQPLWANALGWTHLVMAAMLSALGLVARQLAKHPLASSHGPRWISIVVVLFGLLIASVVVAIDQLVTTNITPFLIGTLLMGVLFGLRPRDAVAIYGIAFLFFTYCLGLTQSDAAILLTNRLNGLTATAVGLVLSISNWRMNTENMLLRRRLDRRQTVLQTRYAQMEVLATRDPLTGLYNRKEFMRLADIELVKAMRYGLSACILVGDVDHFKHVNDDFGHPVGDLVLKHVAHLLLASTRGTDLVGRLGGEEFIVLLPQTSIADGMHLADKIRMGVEMSPTTIPRNRTGRTEVPLTISVGVVGVAPGESADLIGLYSQADKALYRAKHAGRNRVEAALPSDGVSQIEE